MINFNTRESPENHNRLVHVSSYEAPEVAYHDVAEFLCLQREFVREYIELIHKVFLNAYDRPQGESPLTWTERDLIIHGMGKFPDLAHEGAAVVRIMTKGHGIGWSIMVSAWLADLVTAGCRSFARALITWPRNSLTLSDIYSRTLRQEMITSMFDNLTVFDALYDSSFVKIDGLELGDHPLESWSSSMFLTREAWRKHQLAFAMITHERLKPKSLALLDSDVVSLILTHVIVPASGSDKRLYW